jgi:thiol-disulfide isomerase/thioredoxin
MLDPNKDALIVFTASWCGFCKRFDPDWRATVAAFKNVKRIQFKQVEEKDFPAALQSDPILRAAHEHMRGYPSLVYYHSSLGSFSLYQKSRELSVLIPSIAQMIGAKLPKMAGGSGGSGSGGSGKKTKK